MPRDPRRRVHYLFGHRTDCDADYDHPFLPCFGRWRDPAPLRAPGFVFDRRITATAMRRSGYCVTAAPDVSDTVTVGAAWLTKGSTATAATPARFMPSASAA